MYGGCLLPHSKNLSSICNVEHDKFVPQQRSMMSAQENLCGEDWKESQQVLTQLMMEYADALRALKGHDSELGLCVLTQWP